MLVAVVCKAVRNLKGAVFVNWVVCFRAYQRIFIAVQREQRFRCWFRFLLRLDIDYWPGVHSRFPFIPFDIETSCAVIVSDFEYLAVEIRPKVAFILTAVVNRLI